MKQLMKTVKWYLVVLLGAWCIGFLGLLLAYCIPAEMVKTESAVEVFENEGPGPILYEGYISTRLDNYTDSLMINTAAYSGSEPLIDRMLLNYHYEIEGMTSFDAFVSAGKMAEGVKIVNYARYWHGYLVFLKPLLCLFDYLTIRMINSIVQMVLILWIIFKMFLSGLKKQIIPVLGMIIVLNPITIGRSLQYSSVFYIVIGTVLYLLYRGRKLIKAEKNCWFMFVVGCVTSYFDFLTYPIATLCIPLVIFEILEDTDERLSLNDIFKRGWAIVSWGIGYVGMWAGKWIIASIFSEQNIMKDAILSALYRVSNGTSDSGTYEKINSFISLKLNLFVLQPMVYIGLAGILLVSIFILSKWFGLNGMSLMYQKKKVLFLSLIGCIPFLWIMIMCNHSYVHYWMTFRNLAATVLSWGCALVEMSGYFWTKRKVMNE